MYYNTKQYETQNEPVQQSDWLQSVLNSSSRLVYSRRRYDHVMPLLRELHWLKMRQRIEYKLAVFVYRCLNGLAPLYLANANAWRTLSLTCVCHQRLHSSSPRHVCPPLVTTPFP